MPAKKTDPDEEVPTETEESTEEEKPVAPVKSVAKPIAKIEQTFDELIANGAETVKIEGTVYAYADTKTLVPKHGLIARKEDLSSIGTLDPEKHFILKGPNSAFSTYVSAVKLLNKVK
jgi:hypothetical protein